MAEKEYIEREKLNDMLEDFCVNETFYDAMQTIPAADVEPVKHGEWFGTVCTACGESTSFYYDCDYCPNCGAKMDGGD